MNGPPKGTEANKSLETSDFGDTVIDKLVKSWFPLKCWSVGFFCELVL